MTNNKSAANAAIESKNMTDNDLPFMRTAFIMGIAIAVIIGLWLTGIGVLLVLS